MGAVNQQLVDELRQRLGGQLERRGELAADPAQADALRRLDAEIGEAARSLAAAERGLKETT
jgi:hypothetical protein